MISLQAVSPSKITAPIVERYFITTAQFSDGQRWENKILPSIIQSVAIDFDSTAPQAILPNGKHIACPGDLILGQFTRSCISILEGRVDFISIHFTPTGLFRVLGTNMAQFSNNILPLPNYIGWHRALRDNIKTAFTHMERISIIEQFIQNNLRPAPIYLDVITEAAEIIRKSNGKVSMNELSRTAGISERNLQRYFNSYIGVSPKAFAQIARFNAVTKLIEDTTAPCWQHILEETGYFDAAHFAKDFKRITGKTPSEYYHGKTAYEKFFNAQ